MKSAEIALKSPYNSEMINYMALDFTAKIGHFLKN